MFKRTLWSLIVVFLLIQFMPVSRTNPAVESDLQAPADVKAVLRTSCYDCHSHETVWPWTGRIAPASWMIARHVSKGREHLNFSLWGKMDSTTQRLARAEIRKEVEKGKMPLKSYTWMHPQAELTAQERQQLNTWLDGEIN